MSIQGILAMSAARGAPVSSISQVQKKAFGSATDASSHNIVLDSTPIQNNLLIICITSDTTVSGTPITGGGWTQVTSAIGNAASYIYYKIAGASESTTITVNLSVSAGCALGCFEYHGISTLDKSNSNVDGAGTTCNTGTTAATTAANELAIVVCGESSSTDVVTSWDNSFVTALSVYGAGTFDCGMNVALRTLVATGTFTSTATLGTTVSNPGGIIATFK